MRSILVFLFLIGATSQIVKSQGDLPQPPIPQLVPVTSLYDYYISSAKNMGTNIYMQTTDAVDWVSSGLKGMIYGPTGSQLQSDVASIPGSVKSDTVSTMNSLEGDTNSVISSAESVAVSAQNSMKNGLATASGTINQAETNTFNEINNLKS